MKKVMSSVLFIVCCMFVSAQTTTEEYFQTNPSKTKLFSADRLSASLTAGVGVSFLNTSKNTFFTSFVAPKMGYQLNERFKLTLGLVHYSIAGNNPFSSENQGCFPSSQKNISGNLVAVGGEYLLNKKWTISGAVMTNVNSLSKNNAFKAASIGMDYKVSEHSTIGIRATVTQGNQDYMFNPTKNSYQYHPVNDVFGGLFTGFAEWGVDALNSSVK